MTRRRLTRASGGMARFAGIWACSAARLVRFSPIAGWGFGADARLTATCRIVHAAHVRRPCGSETGRRTTGDQEGHRVAAAPPGCEWTVSVALHSQPFLLQLRLGYEDPRAQPPAARPGFAVGCVRAGRNAGSVAGVPWWSVVGCARPRTRDGTIGPRDRTASQASRLIHETRNLNLPRRARRQGRAKRARPLGRSLEGVIQIGRGAGGGGDQATADPVIRSADGGAAPTGMTGSM